METQFLSILRLMILVFWGSGFWLSFRVDMNQIRVGVWRSWIYLCALSICVCGDSDISTLFLMGECGSCFTALNGRAVLCELIKIRLELLHSCPWFLCFASVLCYFVWKCVFLRSKVGSLLLQHDMRWSECLASVLLGAMKMIVVQRRFMLNVNVGVYHNVNICWGGGCHFWGML